MRSVLAALCVCGLTIFPPRAAAVDAPEPPLDCSKLIPIACAAAKGNPKTVRQLIDSGVKPDARDVQGQTPLHWAARYSKAEAMAVLINAGADVNAKNTNGGTPLNQVAKYDTQDDGFAARLLISRGADVNVRNGQGWTPLIMAAKWGNAGVVRALLENGVDVTMTVSGMSALDIAKDGGHTDIAAMIQAAQKSGAPLRAPPPVSGSKPAAAAVLLAALGAAAFLLKRKPAAPSTATTLTMSPAAAALAMAPRSTSPGSILGGHYRITGELGRGGMGVVYSAVDETLQRPVAIKQLKRGEDATPEQIERFVREARLVARLRHPNIAEIYNVLNEGDMFLVFELVAGRSLDKVIDEEGRLKPARSRGMLAEVAAALTYAHRQNVIHRDLKPANVMLADDGVVKVMDFGIAHQASGEKTLTTTTVASGSPPYMAPEQAFGSVSTSADIYALAVMAYEMLTGARPFDGPNYLEQKLQRSYTAPAQRDPALASGLDAFFFEALDPDPTKRPRDAESFMRGFDAAIAGLR